VYQKRIVDLGPDSLCAAVSARHRRLSFGHPEGPQGEVGHRYGILLLATDAARRPGLNVVLCGDRLFQQYGSTPVRNWNSSSSAICGLIRTVAAADAILANYGDRAGRRLRNFMHIHVVCNERN